VPLENFAVLPVVTSDFYGYGEEDQDAGMPDGSPDASDPELVLAGGSPTAADLRVGGARAEPAAATSVPTGGGSA
jgi:hypothetical protein